MTGQHLKAKLDQAGVDLPNLARRLRISPQTLNQRLVSQDIRVSTLVEIANATDKQIAYFLEGYTPRPGVDYEADLEQTTRQLLDLFRRLLVSKDETVTALKQAVQAYQLLSKKGRDEDTHRTTG